MERAGFFLLLLFFYTILLLWHHSLSNWMATVNSRRILSTQFNIHLFYIATITDTIHCQRHLFMHSNVLQRNTMNMHVSCEQSLIGSTEHSVELWLSPCVYITIIFQWKITAKHRPPSMPVDKDNDIPTGDYGNYATNLETSY